jgi:MFS family permease
VSAARNTWMPARLVVPALSLTQLMSWGAMYYAFAVLIEPMSAELGLSRTELSARYSIGLLVTGLAAWPVGMLIDRGHSRAVMTMGAVLSAIGLALHAMVQDGTQLWFVWVLLGVSMSGTLYEPAFAMLVRAFPKDYRARITILTLLGGLASTAYWPLTAWLLTHGGWRFALWVMAAAQLLVCAPIHWLSVPPDARRTPARPLHASPGASAAAATATAAPPAPAADRPAWRSPVFLLLVGSFSTNLLVMASIAAHLIGMLRSQGLDQATALLVASCIGPTQVAGRLALFAAEQRLPVGSGIRLIVWLPPLSIVMLLLLGLPLGSSGATIAVALAAAFFWGTGNGMLTIVKGTAVADLVGAAQVATLNGIAAVPSAFMRAAGPFVIAWVWEATGSVSAALACLLATSAGSGLLMLAAVAQRPRGERA